MNDAVTLKEYVERIFEEREKALNLAFKAQQEALAIATTSLNRELEHLNKLRQEVLSDRGEFMTKVEAQGLFDQLSRLQNFNSRVLGFGAALALMAGVIGGFLGQRVGL